MPETRFRFQWRIKRIVNVPTGANMAAAGLNGVNCHSGAHRGCELWCAIAHL